MTTPNKDQNDLPEELQDWIITEQIFKESGLNLDQDTAEHNDFLRNLNAAGQYLANLNGPTVQFAQVTDNQILFAFDEQEPVDLTDPFYSIDDDHQLWALHHRDAEDLNTPPTDTPQISSLTAYGYNHADKMMLFNLQEQRILSINAQPAFAQAMVRALAVEHAMEPWNATRTIYLVGFGEFAHALKYNLAPYHDKIIVVEALTDLAHDYQTLSHCTIFSIGQDAATVSEFIRTTKSFALGMVADVPIGGGFIYFQETEDRGALEPGNLTIFPFLMAEETEDYQAVEANYNRHLQEQPPETPTLPEPPTTTEPKPEEATPTFTDEDFILTDEDLHNLLTPPAAPEEPTTEEPDTEHQLEENKEPTPQPTAPTGYLKLMGPTPELVGENGTITGFPAEVIAYTYLHHHYGDTPPTFSDMCARLWNATPTGSEKSKLSARRKRAKEKLHETIPEAEFITEREGWKVNNLPTDIDLIPQLPASEPLTKTPWASPYLDALNRKIAEATE